MPVISWEVVAYNFNDRWIIARRDTTAYNFRMEKHWNASYWIIDKDYDFSPDNYEEELKRQVIGPLDSISFYKTIKEYGIDLELDNWDWKRIYTK